MRAICFLALVLVGCPDSRTPETTPPVPQPTMPPPSPTPAPTTAPSGVLKGGWTVDLTSKAPGLNPDMFDTPEKRAKVFFDHHATATAEKVTVAHAILDKKIDAEPDAAKDLDALITSTDWAAVAARVKNDGPSEGGTTFDFKIAQGATTIAITTHHLEKHPELVEIVDALKAIAGAP